MQQYIDTVTVTGADDRTSVDQMLEFQHEFPYVEWAILLSRGSGGQGRFPSLKWINRLIDFKNRNKELVLSGHLCGSWVRELLTGNMALDLAFIMDKFPVDRWQINTHAEPHDFEEDAVISFVRDIAGRTTQEVIFQYDNVNTPIMEGVYAVGLENFSAVHDLSHGAGILPENWPAPLMNIRTGYAGGLSPDNLKEQLDKLEPIVGDRSIWIDAETKLRTKDWFDMDKVRKFLEVAKDRVFDSYK